MRATPTRPPRRALAAALACAWGACVVEAAPEAPAGDARTVFVLVVGDTLDPTIGESVAGDLRAVEQAFLDGLPASRRTLALVQDEQATPAGILASVRRLPATKEDAVVVYYAGHGAWADAGPYLRPRGEVLPRADLLAAMREREPRLAVLLTDCCGTYVGETYLYRQRAPDPALFRELFARPRGVVDLTAAGRGQIAVGDKAQGGYFTQALVGVLEGTPREELDADRDGVVSWAEVVARLTDRTREAFQSGPARGLTVEGRVLRGQTPFAFGDLAGPAVPAPASPRRLGTRTVDAGGGRGARIEAVEPETPAAWTGLAPGLVIEGIRVPGDGMEDDLRRTPTAAALRAVLEALPGSRVVTLLVRDPAVRDPSLALTERWIRLAP